MRTLVLILAGGESSRMGQDKAALLRPDGRTQLQHTVDLASMTAPDLVLVSTNIPRNIKGTHELPDRHKDCGPLAGIESALSLAINGDCLLVLPCDMPLLTGDLLEPLLNHCPAVYEDHWLPCSLTVTEDLRNYVLNALTGSGNQRSVKALLNSVRAHRITTRDELQLQSANNPEQWQQLTKSLPQ